MCVQQPGEGTKLVRAPFSCYNYGFVSVTGRGHTSISSVLCPKAAVPTNSLLPPCVRLSSPAVVGGASSLSPIGDNCLVSLPGPLPTT